MKSSRGKTKGAANASAPARRRDRPLTIGKQQIREEIESWSKDKLVEFALHAMYQHHGLRVQVERVITNKVGGSKAADRYREEIDAVLNTGFVEWNKISKYVSRLDALLDAIKTFGKDQPSDAYSVITYFLESIPAIFNSVHDECEIKMFCEELMVAAVALGKTAEVPGAELGRLLIDRYMSDVSVTCRFNDALEVILKAHLDKGSRQTLETYAIEQTALLKDYDKKELVKFAKQLRAQRSTRTASAAPSARRTNGGRK